jgi:hypothetical protein
MPSQKRRSMKKRTTRYTGGDKDVSKCMDTKCNEKEKEKFYEKTKKMFEDSFIENEKILENKKNSLTSEEKESIEKHSKLIKKTLKRMNNITHKKKQLKIMTDSCIQNYCNKGCLGTIFEKGDPSKLPTAIRTKYKGDKLVLDSLTKRRKLLFGKKENILEDDFYEEMKKKDKNKLKKEGAISGCLQILTL